MALLANEKMVAGFVRDSAGQLVVTSKAVGATVRGGALRDPDGRLVVAGI